MATKRQGGPTGPDTADAAVVRNAKIRNARLEFPDEDYARLKAMAQRVHISVSAYIRQAVMERIEADERRAFTRP